MVSVVLRSAFEDIRIFSVIKNYRYILNLQVTSICIDIYNVRTRFILYSVYLYISSVSIMITLSTLFMYLSSALFVSFVWNRCASVSTSNITGWIYWFLNAWTVPTSTHWNYHLLERRTWLCQVEAMEEHYVDDNCCFCITDWNLHRSQRHLIQL